MVKHSPDYNIFAKYLETTKFDLETKWNYKSWVSALGRDQDPSYHQVMEQVVEWTRSHHDEVLECLLCLMIFFSQTESDAIEGFSQNIDRIQQSWRFRYIYMLIKCLQFWNLGLFSSDILNIYKLMMNWRRNHFLIQ